MKIFMILTVSLCAVQCSDILIKVIQETYIGHCEFGCRRCPDDFGRPDKPGKPDKPDKSNDTLAQAEENLSQLEEEKEQLEQDVQEAEAAETSVGNAGNATTALTNAATGGGRRRRRRRVKRATDTTSFTSCEDNTSTVEGTVTDLIITILKGILDTLNSLSSTNLDVTKLDCYIDAAEQVTNDLNSGNLNKPNDTSAIETAAADTQSAVTSKKEEVEAVVEAKKEALEEKEAEIVEAKEEVISAGGSVDNPNTTPEPSTTPVNDAESPTAKATTTEPTTTPPTTTEPTTTQPTTTPPTTTEPTTTQPTTTPPTTTEPTTTPPTTTEPTTTPPTTTEPTTTPPTTTQTTTTPPPTTQTTTTPPTTTQTTTTPPTTTQTTTTPPTTTQTTTTPPTTTQTTTTTPTTSASTSASQGPAVTRLYCNDDCGQSTVTVPRIVGGEEATIHEYPWQVLLTVTALAFPNGATCGASIIKKGWILTAAHCFVDPNTVALYPGLGLKVTVAEHDTDNASETEEIDITPTGNVLFVHPDYKQADRNSEEHDIALVYLGGTLTFGSGIKPICMPVESDYTPEKEVVVTGWGVTQWQGDQPPKLQEVALNLKSQADCETLNNNAPATYAISGNMVCALGPNKDACQGDSGGPLVTQSADGRWVQLGVVSFGYQCAVTNVPGFYTKVSNYIPWITQTTGNTDC